MKKEFLASTLIIFLSFSCSIKQSFDVEGNQHTAANTVVSERHEYWDLEEEVTKEDTVLHLADQYHISMTTYSLNDSAAVYTGIDEMGEIIIHAHNRETKIEILKNQKPFIKTALGRNIFKDRDQELRLFGTSFLKYESGEFVFTVNACVPDSDVCDAAEVAVDQKGQVRVKGFLEYEEVEE